MVWCGLSLKTPNLLGGFWLCPTPYPALMQVALIFQELPWVSHFLEHLVTIYTWNWQDKVKLRPLKPRFLGWTGITTSGQVSCSCQQMVPPFAPGILPASDQGGSCLAVIPILQRNYFLENVFLSSCLCPILGLLVQVNRNVFSLMLHF